jgi:hypothetical protein
MGEEMTVREEFERICAGACDRRGWQQSGAQIEVKFDDGRHQVVHIEYFEHGEDELVRFYTVIGSTRRIRADRLTFALELNFSLPHGSMAVKNEQLVMVDTLMLPDADLGEIEAAVAFLAETADYYEHAMYGPDAH